MTDLKTRYLGLELKNPIIVGACNLVNDPDQAKKMEDAGDQEHPGSLAPRVGHGRPVD